MVVLSMERNREPFCNWNIVKNYKPIKNIESWFEIWSNIAEIVLKLTNLPQTKEHICSEVLYGKFTQ